MEQNSFYNDMCNISRVLPYLLPSTIFTELNSLKDCSDRVQIIIRKYLEKYEPEEQNCMARDIKLIKRVLPNYPIVKISNDLGSVKNKEYRVQIVLKNYFDQNKTLKRLGTVDITDEISDKKLKLNDSIDPSLSFEPVHNISNIENSLYGIDQDIHLETKQNSETSIPNLEKCSNVTNQERPQDSDNITIVINQDIPQDKESKTVEVQIETTNDIPTDNTEDADNKMSYTSKETNMQINSDVNLPENSVLSILRNLFPQHSSAVFNTICQDLGVNMYDETNEDTTGLVVNVLLNYASNADKLKQGTVGHCANQTSVVTSDSLQSTENCSTEEYNIDEELKMEVPTLPYEDNKSVFNCDEPSRKSSEQDYAVNLKNNLLNEIVQEILNINNCAINNDVQTSSVSEGQAQTTDLPPENLNILSNMRFYSNITTDTQLENVSPLRLNEPTTSTSNIYSNFESSDSNSPQSTNTVNLNYSTELNNERFDTPSTSSDSLQNNSAINNMIKLQNDHKIKATNLFSQSVETNSFLPSVTRQTERFNSIIKPALFHPTTSSKDSSLTHFNAIREDLKTNSNVIIKPASFNPKTTTLKSQISKFLTVPPVDYSLPSTSGMNNNLKAVIIKNPVPLKSCCIPTTNKQDINKNKLRVRTDLYDAYFNGSMLEQTRTEYRNNENNDDIIFVSSGHVSCLSAENVVKSKKSAPKTENLKKEVKLDTNSVLTQQAMPSDTKNHQFYYKLLEIFPDICPKYLKQLCSELKEDQSLDDMITILLNENYKKRDRPATPEGHLDFEQQHKMLQDLFPDADPTYLQHHCERFIDQPEGFKEFVAALIENKNYPTKEDYQKKMKLSAQEKQYTTEFNVKNFLEVIPNPAKYFEDPKRQVISGGNIDDMNYAITFLKNTFCTTAIRYITQVFKKTNYSVLHSAQVLETFQNMKSKRKPYPVMSCKNIPLLQEIAYVKHRKEIEEYLQSQELAKQAAKENAKTRGLMKTCQCCYDDEIMPDDTATCEAGLHIFCKSCVRKGCEVVIGDGKLEFPCLETCDSFFTLQVLQIVLSPKIFSKMAQRKQLHEVKSAGIEDLESCPFCDFATIPAPGDKIFRCLNDDCMKESCRLCKEPSHIPLRCDEVEKDNDVRMRTYIENKMTEALLRKCYKCGLKFIKESGCNKMTCSCGAMMCYVCNMPVKNYKHFNGQGGDNFQLCPLYSDTHKLHVDAIKRGAESAKKELGLQAEEQLKIDPSADLEQHYRRLAEQNPAVPNVPPAIPNIPINLPHNIYFPPRFP